MAAASVPPLYPSSPIAKFPPPMPARTLRERCGFNLNLNLKVVTAFPSPAQKSDAPCGAPGLWSPKGHLQPHRNNLPRRRKVKRIVLYSPEEEDPAPAPPPPPPPPPQEECHLQEIVPGLFIAFRPEEEAEANWMAQGRFTHYVDIRHATSASNYDEGAVEQASVLVVGRRMHRLRLVLPSAPPPDALHRRAGLALSDTQLRAARDFLSQSLPFSSSHPTAPTPRIPGTESARVVVLTPVRRPTDAMAVLGCYLAHASGKSAEEVIRCIDDEPDVLSVWKGEISGDEMERLEKVARAWSWLKGVRREKA